ncbi:sigma-E processing peptidase SpoIIGA [Anaerosporobacter faecicola]|uniref:sigma-E processing peptidase SpoIIGA n=1 Tax=Anaerosporobacter faecicola TaxID=2718714 RepID=UPI00143921B9|nr:sigma-E processing peptidase SpoIIGA [Anaerosporobacter faecicola]
MDVVFGVNLIMDYLLLGMMQKIVKRESKRGRKILAAVLGGLGACLSICIPIFRSGVSAILIGIIIAGGMLCIAFRYKTVKSLAKDIFMYYAITFLVGGILNYFYYYTSVGYYLTEFIRGLPKKALDLTFLFVLFGIASGFIHIFKQVLQQMKGTRELFYDVELVFGDKKINCKGFLDTGNQLREPISMKPVVIADMAGIKEILPEELIDYAECFSCDAKHKNIDRYAVKIKWIPYHAVGTEEGILPGIVFDEVNILKEETVIHNPNITVAIYQGKLTVDNGYHVILHKELL